MPNSANSGDLSGRIATTQTISPNITAHELARLMILHIRYDRSSLDATTPEQRALVEANSRPSSERSE